MTTASISNLNLLKVFDESTHATYYGCNQEWYAGDRQRRAGCGPTVASTIINYLNHTRSVLGSQTSCNRREICLPFMEEVWDYVTPQKEGIPTTKMFYEDVLSYAKSKGITVEYSFLDVPQDKFLRAPLPDVLSFLETALLKDIPVAFLNLCNGDEDNLDSWHWVTIISLECDKERNSIFVNILDRGLIKKIDLALWYNTTTLGGGFVYFMV